MLKQKFRMQRMRPGDLNLDEVRDEEDENLKSVARKKGIKLDSWMAEEM